MDTTVRRARVAGVFGVLMGAPAPFCLIYLPGKLIVPENAAATAANVLGSEMLFRLGMVGEITSAVFFLLLALALHRLLAGVDKQQARLLVGFVAVSVAVTFANVTTSIAALSLFRGSEYLLAFDKPQRDALGMLFLRLHGQGTVVNQIFWGLWLLPFGVLVMRSRFIPRILGVLLVLNGVAYVVASLTALLWPVYAKAAFNAVFPALLGELWIILWLLIKGARPQALAAKSNL